MAMQINNLLYLLINKKLLSTEDALLIEQKVSANPCPIVPYLMDQFHLNGKDLAAIFADLYNLPYMDLQTLSRSELPSSLTHDIFKNRIILPLNQHNGDLYIVIADPYDIDYIPKIQFHLGVHIKVFIAEYEQLVMTINNILTKNLSKNPTTFSAIESIEHLLSDAIHRQASDIHFDPFKEHYRIRFRIDGILHSILECPTQIANTLNSRLKILAQLDIAEKRLPQDGHLTYTTTNGRIRDCRISTCPSIFGEKLVVRILKNSPHLLNISELGFNSSQEKIFLNALKNPQGLILVTGPTGSGKTITLYAALNHLNSSTKNIISVEDPVEIQLPGITQIQVHHKINFAFAEALRTILRQDPDIIMIGEIRDRKTAQIAIRAAQTGHLVLATLHTNNAVQAFTRLINMGIPSFLLAHSISLIIAQRLVRTLCIRCKSNPHANCHSCSNGYKGRTGIYELLPLSSSTQEHLLGLSSHSLIEYLKKYLLNNLWQAALEKVEQKLTDHQEILRVIGEPTP